MKVSTKTKLAAVGVAAVLAIGGGGVVYHHTLESNPVSESRSVVVNKQGGSETQAALGDSSTDTAHQTDATDGAGDQANRHSTDTKVDGRYARTATGRDSSSDNRFRWQYDYAHR